MPNQTMLLLATVLGLALMGCSPSASVERDSSPSPSPLPSDIREQMTGPGQILPVAAVVDFGEARQIYLEVAETREQQTLGLMYRPALPDDRGMVFPFSPARPVSFWMHNVPVALDMVFVYQDKIQAIAAAVPPCADLPCPSYGPGNQLVDHVIELRAGRAAELGLQAGDRAVITPLESPLRSE